MTANALSKWQNARKGRTHPKEAEAYTPITAAQGVEQAFKMLEGRWKLVILFHLFGGKLLRFSDLERASGDLTKNAGAAATPNGERRHRPPHRSSSGTAQGRVWADRMGPALCPRSTPVDMGRLRPPTRRKSSHVKDTSSRAFDRSRRPHDELHHCSSESMIERFRRRWRRELRNRCALTEDLSCENAAFPA